MYDALNELIAANMLHNEGKTVMALEQEPANRTMKRERFEEDDETLRV